MTQANDSILVTPGSGATVATHLANSKEHQVVMLADSNGHLAGTRSVYVAFIPPLAVGSNKVFFDLFNATGTGLTVKVLAIQQVVEADTAVTGTLSIQLYYTRTTAVGTGGTAATADGTSLTAATISKWDPANSSLPAGVTLRTAPTGGATGGAVLLRSEVAPEETNTSMAYVSQLINVIPAQLQGVEDLAIPENTGLRCVQGPIASVGAIGWNIWFSTE